MNLKSVIIFYFLTQQQFHTRYYTRNKLNLTWFPFFYPSSPPNNNFSFFPHVSIFIRGRKTIDGTTESIDPGWSARCHKQILRNRYWSLLITRTANATRPRYISFHEQLEAVRCYHRQDRKNVRIWSWFFWKHSCILKAHWITSPSSSSFSFFLFFLLFFNRGRWRACWLKRVANFVLSNVFHREYGFSTPRFFEDYAHEMVLCTRCIALLHRSFFVNSFFFFLLSLILIETLLK